MLSFAVEKTVLGMAHLAPVQIVRKKRLMLPLPPPATPSAKSLLKALISLTKVVSSCGKPKACQSRNVSNIVRRVELLAALFEEIRESRSPIPPSAVVGFQELHRLVQRIYILLEECREMSVFWLLMEQEEYNQYFYELTQTFGSVLSSMPLELLDLSEEAMEQTLLVRAQVLRARLALNPVEVQLRENAINMLQMVERNEIPRLSQLGSLFNKLQLLNATDCETEIHRLEDISMQENRKDDEKTQHGIAGLISFVRYGKYVLHSADLDEVDDESSQVSSRNSRREGLDEVSTSRPGEDAAMVGPPVEFLCPITLDLMRDPVIVTTGQTYDRTSITRWIQEGHSTCPKTSQKLDRNKLISNHALKSLISQWCEDHDVPYENGTLKAGKKVAGIQHVHSTRVGLGAMRLTATFLIEKLATGNVYVQKHVARELHLLSKSGADGRISIAEAGGVPLLLPLLSSSDAKTQEHAITTLLNLSLVKENSKKIVSAGSLERIIEVLKSGHTMEARENAAATLFSISVSDEFKVEIGSTFGAIPSLITLLRDGSMQRGKKDAVTALFNLAVYHGNKAKIIKAGAVPLLVVHLSDQSSSIAETCAAVLTLLATSPDAIDAIHNAASISEFLPLLRNGSPKGRENLASILLSMCLSGDQKVIDDIFLHLKDIVPILHSLLLSGTPRAKRKAASLLKLLSSLNPAEVKRCFSGVRLTAH